MYDRFFASVGDDPRFLVGLEGDRVVGGAVATYRDVRIRGRTVRACYGVDWKLSPDCRGRSLGRQMMTWAAPTIVKDKALRAWKYGYVAARSRADGDVMQVTKGLPPGKLVKAAGTLAVYFVEPSRLAALALEDAPATPDPEAGVDLSYVPAGNVVPPGLVSTAGTRDFRLRSTGRPWPLVHLPCGPSRWSPTWGAYLRECGGALAASRPSSVACFAVDQRLGAHVAWLASQGIVPGATCTVYALDLTLRARRATWLHLATSEM